MDCILIIDDRERAVVAALSPTAQAPSSAQPWYRVQRLTYGDYALVCGETTVMIIERKTYTDFAQSFKDERILNFTSLIALRAEFPHIELALLVEGHRPRDESEKISGIPYRNIRAKINHLRLRDKFHVFETQDIVDTAACLRGLVADTSTLYRGSAIITGSSSTASTASTASASSTPSDLSASPVSVPPSVASAASTQSIAARHPLPRTIAEEVCSMFERFPGIGAKYATEIVQSGMSIAIFVQELTPPRRFARLMTKYQRERNETVDRDILARVTRITPTIASSLLDFARDTNGNASIAHLCALSREQLMSFRHNNRQYPKLCARLWDCLHYRAMT